MAADAAPQRPHRAAGDQHDQQLCPAGGDEAHDQKTRSGLCCRIVFRNSWVKRLGQGCAVVLYFATVGSKD